MPKTNVQDAPQVWEETSASIVATGSLSGSLISHGYARLTGLFFSDVDTETASGLKIEQSADLGTNWDYVSASDLIAACTITACSVEIVGNAVRVTAITGASAASDLRTTWRLRPI